MRVETGADGTYEAHVITSDGTHVEVKMDADFKVTSTAGRTGEMRGGMRDGMRGGHGPGGGHRGGPGADDESSQSDDDASASPSSAT